MTRAEYNALFVLLTLKLYTVGSVSDVIQMALLQIVPGSPNINVTAWTRVAQSGDTTDRAGCSLNIPSPHVVVRNPKTDFGWSRFIYT
jgi:hypothetical protein